MRREFKVAIVMSNPAIQTETFIRRHVDSLFSGKTVVVATKSHALYPNRPTLCLSPKDRPRKWKQFIGDLLPSPIRQRWKVFALRSNACLDFFREHRVGFILAEFGPQGLSIYQQANIAGIPMFCYFRGYDASKRLRDPTYVRALQEMCRNIQGIVSVSRFLISNLHACGISCAQEWVIPSGVDSKVFLPTDKHPYSFLSVGRFVSKKAPQITIMAFARAYRDNPELFLDMVGDGPEMKKCQSLCEQLGIGERVKFHGAIDHSAVRLLMGRATYFLQHSVTAEDGDAEGMPSAVQEAMSCGCVVIATRHAGIPEHISHDVTGVLVDEYDIDQYGLEIIRLCRNSKLTKDIALKARAYAVAQLDYRMLFKRLEGLIESEIMRDLEGKLSCPP